MDLMDLDLGGDSRYLLNIYLINLGLLQTPSIEVISNVQNRLIKTLLDLFQSPLGNLLEGEELF